MTKQILIIDDDPDYVEAVSAMIESRGHKVEAASDSTKGLKKINDNKPDLIILDVMMETKDEGFRFARKLKRNDEFKNIPILMLTSIREATGFDFSLEVGDNKWLPVDDYCDKLVKKEDLLAKIEKLLKL